MRATVAGVGCGLGLAFAISGAYLASPGLLWCAGLSLLLAIIADRRS